MERSSLLVLRFRAFAIGLCAAIRMRPWTFPWRIGTCRTAYRYDGLQAAWRWIVYSEDPSAEYEPGDAE